MFTGRLTCRAFWNRIFRSSMRMQQGTFVFRNIIKINFPTGYEIVLGNFGVCFNVIINPVSAHKTVSVTCPPPAAPSSPITFQASPRIRTAVWAATHILAVMILENNTLLKTVMLYRRFVFVYEFQLESLKSSGFKIWRLVLNAKSARTVNKMQNISNENIFIY